MKKIGLLLVGLLAIGLYANNSVVAQEEQDQVSEVEVVEESNGEASAEMTEESKQRSLTKAADVRTVNFQKFHIEVTDGAANSVSVPISNSKFTISYTYNNRDNLLYEGMTNEKGQILNLPPKEIPFEVTALKIRFTLGNDSRGYVQQYNKVAYRFLFNCGLNAANTTNTINYTNTKIRFGNASDDESWFYNFQASRINHYFDKAVQEYSHAVASTNELFPDTVPFEVAPININFQKGEFLDKPNGFSISGHDGSKVSDIVIADRSSKKFSTTYLMHNVMHEWSHWNVYRYAHGPGRGYDSHFSYNTNPNISFKEGWCLFVGDIFAHDYDISYEDNHVQTDNQNGVNRLFGKSTNYTVKQVLYDLVDTGSNDETFSLSQRYLDGEMSDIEIRRLNLGILHTVIAESKTVTLQELLAAVEKKYVLTKSDKEKFAQLLEINGLSRDGAFKLDNDGNPLTVPLQAMEPLVDGDKDWDELLD